MASVRIPTIPHMEMSFSGDENVDLNAYVQDVTVTVTLGDIREAERAIRNKFPESYETVLFAHPALIAELIRELIREYSDTGHDYGLYFVDGPSLGHVRTTAINGITWWMLAPTELDQPAMANYSKWWFTEFMPQHVKAKMTPEDFMAGLVAHLNQNATRLTERQTVLLDLLWEEIGG